MRKYAILVAVFLASAFPLHQSLAFINASPVVATTTATSTNTRSLSTNSLNKGLVGYWTMDGKDINWTTNTIVDRSGNGNTGTLVGLARATSTALGKVGQAMKFDGVINHYISLGNPASLQLGNNPQTISAWVKSSGQGYVFASRDSSTGDISMFVGTGVKIVATVGDTIQTYSNTTIADGKWHHSVIVYDGSAIYYFLDGKADGSDTSVTGVWNSSITKNIGRREQTGYLPGLIDDVRIYNRALTPAEVKQLYQQSAKSFANASPVVATTTATSTNTRSLSTNSLNKGLVGYWTMDGKDINWTTNTIVDRSGNGNTGTLVGLARATSTALGKVGQAFMFNGTSSYISIADNSSLSFTNHKFAFSFWATSIGPNDAILQKVSSNNVGPWEYAIFRTSTGGGASTPSGSMFQFSMWTNVGDGVYANLVNPPADVKWHHWVWSADGQVSSVYLDGVLATSSLRISNNSSFDGTAALNIGRGGASDYWGLLKYRNGPIDDLRIYNRALTPAEVKQLYQQTAKSFANASPVVATTTATSTNTRSLSTNSLNKGLVGYWTMDGKDINWTTNTIVDRSGNGNTGTLVGLGKATSTALGKVGQSLSFSAGNSASVALSNVPILTTKTVSMWVKPTFINTHNMLFGGAALNYVSLISSGGIEIGYRTGSNAEAYPKCGTSNIWKTNNWYHITVVYDIINSSKIFCYVNGQGYSVAATDGENPVGPISRIGAYKDTTSNLFTGPIDDVRIYNRALSAQEVKQLYSQGR